ncbi:uncharacterized protein [Oscarella lobularis]|uniref:uncharacterized protein n=1 Tax=Oscarella lobularis TaxID=121494 RepID=UPI003313482F
MAEGSDIFKEINEHLTKTQTLLETERAKLKDEREKMEHDFPILHKFTSDPIKLNIGGQIFMTSLSTLTRDPKSMLASMFSGRFDLKPGEDGSYFIDRDPTHFCYILNYLRTGKIIFPEKKVARRRLQLEAEFFNIQAIAQLLTSTSNPVLPESVIVSSDSQYQEVLALWLQDDGIGAENWMLIYRGTRDGFQASTFHSLCDNKGATISVIKTTHDYIFGGYTNVGWKSSGEHVQSTSSFLFAFVSHALGSQSFRAFSTKNSAYAAYHNASCHVVFGGGCDLLIADQSNTKSNSSSNWGHTYDLPPGKDANWLTGQQNFQTVEIEVFARQ